MDKLTFEAQLEAAKEVARDRSWNLVGWLLHSILCIATSVGIWICAATNKSEMMLVLVGIFLFVASFFYASTVISLISHYRQIMRDPVILEKFATYQCNCRFSHADWSD